MQRAEPPQRLPPHGQGVHRARGLLVARQRQRVQRGAAVQQRQPRLAHGAPRLGEPHLLQPLAAQPAGEELQARAGGWTGQRQVCLCNSRQAQVHAAGAPATQSLKRQRTLQHAAASGRSAPLKMGARGRGRRAAPGGGSRAGAAPASARRRSRRASRREPGRPPSPQPHPATAPCSARRWGHHGEMARTSGCPLEECCTH